MWLLIFKMLTVIQSVSRLCLTHVNMTFLHARERQDVKFLLVCLRSWVWCQIARGFIISQAPGKLNNWMAWCKTYVSDFFGWNFYLQKWLNFLKRAKKEKSFVVSVHCAPFNILCSFFIFEGQKLSPEKVTFVSLAPSHSIVRMILPPLVWPSRRNFSYI